MKSFGLFQAPYISPQRAPRTSFDWLVAQASAADRAGLTEFWVGEHSTPSWENVPAPELVLAAAVSETDQIVLAPGAHLLPYHHPATLAMQVSWMTHLTEGRYILGVGAGAFPGDAYLRGMKDLSRNHEMTEEALEIMQRIWRAEPFYYEGEFWNAGYPEPMPVLGLRDARPYGGEVAIAMAGISAESPSLGFAGRSGYQPLSIFTSPDRLTRHWDTYAEAARGAGREADRESHHVLLDVFVGETDAEARRGALAGGMGDAWRHYVLPFFSLFVPEVMKPVEGLDTDAAMEWVADNIWIVGSPDTVAEKIGAIAERAGGRWGTTMVNGYDYIDDPDPWNASLGLLVGEVGPRLALA